MQVWISGLLTMADEIRNLINIFTEKYKNVLSRVKSCSEPKQLGPGQAVPADVA